MNRSIHAFAIAGLAFAAALTGAARAQQAPAAPAPSAPPTVMDAQYDGNTHWMVAPYVWVPTVNGSLRATVPAKGTGIPPFSTAQLNVQVGPNSYLTKLNAAAMLAFDVRKGNVSLYGDYIYLNVASGSTFVSSISGPGGKIVVPVNLATSLRLTSSLSELAVGYTIARSHYANLDFIAGWRQAPLTTTLAYTLDVGKKGFIDKSGTVRDTSVVNDVLFGFRGRAFLGGSHWYVPYYADIGAGYNNVAWQAYSGAGYQFRTQSVVLLWRNLAFTSFPADNRLQKLTIGGPLLGYTFGF